MKFLENGSRPQPPTSRRMMNACVAISQHWHKNDMDHVASPNMCSVTHFVCVAGLIYVTCLIRVLLSASAGIATAVTTSRPIIRVV